MTLTEYEGGNGGALWMRSSNAKLSTFDGAESKESHLPMLASKGPGLAGVVYLA